VTVVEAAPRREAPSADAFDVRVYAVSPGSRAWLRDLGAWDALNAKRINPVRRMEIFGDGGANLSFSARPGAALAWILEAGRLTAAIEAHAASLSHVRLLHGAAGTEYRASAERVAVALESGGSAEGDLLVGSDGPDSPVRAALGIAFEESAYDEQAVVANFETQRPHADTARQWFRSDGVLAWLPLPGSRISIVWSTANANAEALSALPQAEFEERVRAAGGDALGALRLISPVARFPLRRIRVPEPIAPGVALIGDAAHAVHPLAGQGVNLGFQDARVLAEAISERTALERPGDLAVLRRYARERREDVTAMQFVTDGLDKLFASDRPGLYSLRNWGLKLLDSQEWAKDALAGRAMR
jgi:2-octaprenyl-6-methoxyphenol hydroxylase